MRRRKRDRPEIEHVEPQALPAVPNASRLRLPLAEVAEAGAERAALMQIAGGRAGGMKGSLSSEPGWRALRRQRDATERGRTIGQ
jgi:hypothetical protein